MITQLSPLLYFILRDWERLGNFLASSETGTENWKDYTQLPKRLTYILSFPFHCNFELDMSKIIPTFQMTKERTQDVCTKLEFKL